MRCFLGFDLDASSKLAIEQWRNNALPPFERPVPPANFHVTSAFLGQADEHQLDALCSEIDKLEWKNFSMTFDHLGFWSKPGILFLGASEFDATATRISRDVSGIAKSTGLFIHERKYVPHVTLVRKVRMHAPAPLMPPEFTVKFNQLHLFESLSGKHGVTYPIRASWDLRPF